MTLIRKTGFVSRTYRHVNRYRQILTVLIKYGFGDLVERTHIAQYLELGLQLFRTTREHVEKHGTAERVRMMLEELGPTFIKLGQVLSTRPDLAPADWMVELRKLQQDVPAFPFEQVRAIVEEQLERPLVETFSRFDEKALAAASIGQVHRAALHTGEEVVVKVQRPDIESVIEVDLEILFHLATLVERHLPGWRIQRPTRVVEEFSRVIEKELDYTAEAAHLDRFAAQFRRDSIVYVPKVYRALTTRRMIVMEYVDGVSLSEISALDTAGFDRRLIAARGAELTLRQVFEHGFFHADPHPGNIFALPGNVICLLDFGMVGRIERSSRERFADLLYSVAGRDAARTTLALLRLTERDDEVDPDHRSLERDVAEFIDTHVVTRIGDLDFGRLLHEMLALLNRHRLQLPTVMITMLKALATIESVARELDPSLDMIARAVPYVRRLRFERLGPRRVLREFYDSGNDLIMLAREIPGGVRDLLRLAKRGNLKVAFEHRGLENMLDTNERIANRVSFAIVVAALIVGSSLIVHSQIPPKIGEVPVIGVAGFILAGVMAFLLLLSILRHGRM